MTDNEVETEMCVVSMVHDHFLPQFEPFLPKAPVDAQPWPYVPGITPQFEPSPPSSPFVFLMPDEIATLREMIAQFREAKAAAERVDALTKQPDCVDPEKAKLLARIDALEAALARPKSKTKRKTATKTARA